MGPILPADVLDASGKKERRTKRLTFIECHAKKKKKVDFQLLLEKQRSVFHSRPPTPWVLFLTRPASAELGSGCPLWRAHVLCSSSPSPWEPS